MTETVVVNRTPQERRREQSKQKRYITELTPVYQTLLRAGYKFSEARVLYHNIGGRNLIEPEEEVEGQKTFSLEIGWVDYDLPHSAGFSEKLVREKSSSTISAPSFTQDSTFTLAQDKFKMHILEAEDTHATQLNLGLTTLVADKPFDVARLPIRVGNIETAFDLKKRPDLREKLGEIAQRRLPAEIFPGDIMHRSELNARKKDGAGFDVSSRIFLKEPANNYHLKCYEIEVFEGEGKDEVKNIPETTQLSSESVWQENEKHFCLADQDTYPFIPFDDLNAADRLSVSIRADLAGEDMLAEHLSDFTLSFDGSNEWFALRQDGQTEIEIIHSPRWRRNALKLNYREEIKERITAEQIQNGVNTLRALKHLLKTG